MMYKLSPTEEPVFEKFISDLRDDLYVLRKIMRTGDVETPGFRSLHSKMLNSTWEISSKIKDNEIQMLINEMAELLVELKKVDFMKMF